MSDDEEEVAAALDARLQTLEHLDHQEAATMLSRMAPQQAAQLVLLMGSSKRSEVLQAMTEADGPTEAQKGTIAAALPADTAQALGLQSEEKAVDGSVLFDDHSAQADCATFQPPERGSSKAEGPNSDRAGETSEVATGSVSEQPSAAAEATGTVVAEVEAVSQQQQQQQKEQEQEESKQQEQEEEKYSQEQGQDQEPELEKQQEETHGVDKAESASSSTEEEAEDAALAPATIEIPKHCPAKEAPSDVSHVQEAEVALQGSPVEMRGEAAEEPPEVVEVEEDGIVDTWLINDKPAVREHVSVRGYMPRPAQMHPESSSRDAAQVAFHLGPLPDHTIARYLEELPPQECEAVLENFPPERRRLILDHLCEDASSSSSTHAKPRVSQLGERALGFAGTMAARAKQGISEMAPEASTKTAAASQVAASEMKRAAQRASHAAGWARSSMSQAADKAAATKSAEYAKTAANSALSAARVGVSSAAHQASSAAGTARHSVEKFVASSSSSPAVESSSRVARQMTQEAKQKVSGAAEVAKGGLASMSKGMATLFKSSR